MKLLFLIYVIFTLLSFLGIFLMNTLRSIKARTKEPLSQLAYLFPFIPGINIVVTIYCARILFSLIWQEHLEWRNQLIPGQRLVSKWGHNLHYSYLDFSVHYDHCRGKYRPSGFVLKEFTNNGLLIYLDTKKISTAASPERITVHEASKMFYSKGLPVILSNWNAKRPDNSNIQITSLYRY